MAHSGPWHCYLAPMPEVLSAHPDVHLHPGKEKGILRGHPWVFSGAIARISVESDPPQEGDWVRVMDARGASLGWGHWGGGSIAVRIIDEGAAPAPPDPAWWAERLGQCADVRRSIGLAPGSGADTNAFRLVHGEGDGLSGLVVDWYDGLAVVQTHSVGMDRAWPHLLDGLRVTFGDALLCVVNKSAGLLARIPGSPTPTRPDGVVWSAGEEKGRTTIEADGHPVLEHGLHYLVDPIDGQKTGFFLDQRDNRKLLMEWAGNRSVLNAFSYTGGFSMAALAAGSPHVVSLDASALAIAAAERHAELNGFADRHEGVQGDVMEYLRQAEVLPELVILDPPAYAKSRTARHKAVQGYKRLNALALSKMPEGGLLWTFSCSQVVDATLFEDTIVAAAIGSDREVRILRRLGQPGDHPTRAGHPEARYLKGLVLHVGGRRSRL